MDVKPASRTKRLLQPVAEDCSLPFAVWVIASFLVIHILWELIDWIWAFK